MEKLWFFNNHRYLFACVGKFLKIMKISIFIMVFATMQTYAFDNYAQTKKMDVKIEHSSIVSALEQIEAQSEFFFFYNNKVVKLDKKVSVDLKDKTIDEILNVIFKDTGIEYTINNRQIILSAKETGNSPSQQKKSVSGKVTDQSGAALPGVSVVVKGTTMGMITDNEGHYSLSNIPENATLQFSFIGMKTQQILVGSQTTIDVSLIQETIGLEEVVAVGYGMMKKEAVTGAVTKANLDLYKNVPVNNILETVKGSVAGLNIGGINMAGGVADLTIRGQNTISAGTTPLIVVDGAIYSGSLADIPTEDVASFTVLKDASAAAVYGSRSANGVILIETKKGEGISGKPKFNVKLNTGLSNQLEPLKTYDGPGYLQRVLDIRATNGATANPSDIALYLQPIEAANYNATPDHRPTIVDPAKIFSHTGNMLDLNVSVSNSTEKTDYYISTTLTKQKGVLINDDFKHISGRVNISSDLTKWFNLGIKSSYSLKDYSGYTPTSMMWLVNTLSPYGSLYDENGQYRELPQSTTSCVSPYWLIATEDADIRNALNGIVSATIKAPWVKGLSYQVNYSNSLNWTNQDQFWNKRTYNGEGKNGYGNRANAQTNNMLLDNMIKYYHTFAEKHNVDVTLLYSRESTSWKNVNAYAEKFDNAILGTYSLQNGSVQTVTTGGGETNAIGMMARGSYTYNQKYSITGTIRRDGYSAFSKNKKWGVFPSAGINWNISKESFMKDVAPVKNLALRASYGVNGNQSISPYSTLARIATSMYVYYPDNSYTITQYISSLANNDLGWESTTGLNLGIDFSLFDNKRLSGSIDGYLTKTNDLMFSLAVPSASGTGSIMSNIGEIKNKGIEINLHSLNLDMGNFKWYSDIAFSINRNKVVTILGQDNNGDGKEDDLINSNIFIGKPLGTIYNYKVTGMWQQADKDNGTIMQGMRPGDYKLEDVNNDGAITSTKDRQFLGNTNPNFRWSFTNTLQYKKFSLMAYLYSIWGGNDWYLSTTNTPYYDGYANSGSCNVPVYDYWTPTNTNAMFPRTDYSQNARYKGRKYIDRSFIKLQKVSLTYDATSLVKPWGINGLSFSVSADNLFTYAPHWVGLDPETNNGLTDNAIPSIRTYLLSATFNF